ncbi:MAG: trehalose-phosphatase [Alphaproteobacteria bacterium]|jgi:trehalose 6-phosphate phosphatase|nr:trehalose-phosphatase [Alphaproteobacteria bacterium]
MARPSGATSGRLPVPPPLCRDHALFLDFDGTLVEIAATPDLVRVAPELPLLLGAIADFLDGSLALVSGRPLDDLVRLLAPFSGAMAGQHGRERRRSDGSVLGSPVPPALARAAQMLANFAERHPGVMLEDKGGTLALHYRQAPSLEVGCRERVRRVVDATGGALKSIDGKMVVELMPRTAGKGQAIAAFLAEPPFKGRMPVFVGDDSGDEEGFVVVDRLGGVSVHVGVGPTAARHRLADVAEVLAWLARSVSL